jgi:hypothetical protein
MRVAIAIGVLVGCRAPIGDGSVMVDDLDLAGPIAKPEVVDAATRCTADDPLGEASLRTRLAILGDEGLAGRPPGSAGDRWIRAHVRTRFRCLGLEPGGDDGSYDQVFENEFGVATANVIGYLPGRDPQVGAEIVVIGAHHDHVGMRDGKIYPGANDNASGVTGVVALAEAIAALPVRPRRTIAFVAFGSEENGIEGSAYFVNQSPKPLPIQRVVYMINLDMIGSYASKNEVWAFGTFRNLPAREILDALDHRGLTIQIGASSGQSDHVPFCKREIPYVFWWTPDGRCYHKPCDTVDKIDFPSMSAISRVAFDLATRLADAPVDLAASRTRHGCRP